MSGRHGHWLFEADAEGDPDPESLALGEPEGESVGEPVSVGDAVALTVGVGGPPVGGSQVDDSLTLGDGEALGSWWCLVRVGVGETVACLCGFLALWLSLGVTTTAGAD